MASFVEQATLKVNDQSSAQIRKINAELKKLFATAKSLKSMKADINIKAKNLSKVAAEIKNVSAALKGLRSGNTINVNARGISKAAADVRRLVADLNRLKTAQAVNIRANTSAATAQINRVRQQAQKPVVMKLIGAGLGVVGAHGAARVVGRAAIEGTKQADLGETNLDQLQLGKERRDYVDKQVKETEDRLKGLAGPYQFNTGHVQQRMAENLREVREGEAAKALRIRSILPGRRMSAIPRAAALPLLPRRRPSCRNGCGSRPSAPIRKC